MNIISDDYDNFKTIFKFKKCFFIENIDLIKIFKNIYIFKTYYNTIKLYFISI